MWRIASRNLTAFWARSAATAVAVALGVGFLSGTLVLADTFRAALDDTSSAMYSSTDIHVRARAAFRSWAGDERPRLSVDVVQGVASIDGVAAAEARIEGYAQLFDSRGAPIGTPEDAVGANWSELADNPFRLVAGHPPKTADEVVIDRGSATAAGYSVGDRVKVATNSGPVWVTVSGVSAFGSADSPDGKPHVHFMQQAAERLLAQAGRIDAVVVAAESGVSVRALADRIDASLPDELEVLTSAELAAEHRAVNAGVADAIRSLLSAFAAVALFVGTFIINNTFSILVAQRTAEVGLLRAVGATRTQVTRSILAEASVVGSIGAVVGAVSAVAVAAGLRVLVASFGFDIPARAMVVRPVSIVVPIAIGILCAVASAVLPARRAAAVPPLAALRDAAVDSSPQSRRRLVTGAALGAVGSVLVFGPLLSGQETPTVIALGAGAIFLGLAIVGPALVAPFVRFIAGRARALGGVPVDLARENTARNARRTSGAAASLMIGVGLVTLISVFASSAKATAARPYDGPSATRPHFVVQPASTGTMGFSPTLAERLDELDEIESVGVARAALADVDGDPGLPVQGVDANWWTMAGPATIEGSSSAPQPGEVSVLAIAAPVKGWTIGGVVTIRFADRQQSFRVSGMRSSGPPFLVDLRSFETLGVDQLDMVVLVRKQANVSTSEARNAVGDVLEDYPTATLVDARGRSPQQMASIEQFANGVYVLLGLALLVALIGIGTALALSIVERTREIGLLRAVGMTERQVRAMIRWESLLVVLFGCGLGLSAGLFFGWAVLQGLPDDAAFRVPLPQLGVVTVLAAAAALVAAAKPARTASRVALLAAIASP